MAWPAKRRDEAQSEPGVVFRFGDHEIDPERGELRCRGELVHVHNKAFQLLCVLVRHRDRTLTSGELLDVVWPDTCVSLWALSSALRDLRRALADHDRRHPIVSTCRGRGYRLAPEVTVLPRSDCSALDGMRRRVALNLHRLSREELLRIAAMIDVERQG